MAETELSKLLPSLNSAKSRRIGKYWIFISLIAIVIGAIHIFDQLLGLDNRSAVKKNVIFFISDGMGPGSLSLARSYMQNKEGRNFDEVLNLDYHLVGSSRTRSSSSLITDSAAGATAFSCGMKTYNGAIGVDSNAEACGTILETAKLAGFMTGLVVRSKITDATPAAFSAHVESRSHEDVIATHQIGDYSLGRMVDLMIGGGRANFYCAADTTYGNHGIRKDNRNLIDEALADGWQYVGDYAEFKHLGNGRNISFPLLALLSDFDMPFVLDQGYELPTLEEQAIFAMNALSEATKDSDRGFFLMIEGSRIDHASHANDPAAHVEEVLDFDSAFQAAVNFADRTSVETLIISTSDHETGGLAIGRQIGDDYPEYVWKPEVLARVRHSTQYLTQKLTTRFSNETDVDVMKSYVKEEIFEKGLGIKDYDDAEVEAIINENDAMVVFARLSDMLSRRALIGWSTSGHTAVDVNVYAYSNKVSSWMRVKQYLMGNQENTGIGGYVANYLGLDLQKTTNLLAYRTPPES
ncbi:HHL184Cp [Eremothecium sinecaudum]|uniref:Alkaline phosphatase n=1 Tax=Eremothecium sinecaudum TaxID=45286 RepID=A0A0X8HVP1_9SACH|nr:HHL184Cp [Eremothecium sinecaudum]AMD22586.1 HHL184Cp [Eremothecium sinecaudum]